MGTLSVSPSTNVTVDQSAKKITIPENTSDNSVTHTVTYTDDNGCSGQTTITQDKKCESTPQPETHAIYIIIKTGALNGTFSGHGERCQAGFFITDKDDTSMAEGAEYIYTWENGATIDSNEILGCYQTSFDHTATTISDIYGANLSSSYSKSGSVTLYLISMTQDCGPGGVGWQKNASSTSVSFDISKSNALIVTLGVQGDHITVSSTTSETTTCDDFSL